MPNVNVGLANETSSVATSNISTSTSSVRSTTDNDYPVSQESQQSDYYYNHDEDSILDDQDIVTDIDTEQTEL